MAMATMQIDFNGHVYSFDAGVNALVLLVLFCLLVYWLRSVGGPQTAVFSTSCEYDGVQDVSTALPRTKLVEALFDMVTNNRIVHLGAPAASGKTSLLQLLQRFAAVRGVTCIYVSMLFKDFESVMLAHTGINPRTWMLESDATGRCVCADPTQQFVVMLDDAQSKYCDVNLWAGLIKTAVASDLP